MFPLPPSPLTSPSRGIYLIRCFKSISLRDTRVHSRAARDGPLPQRAVEEEKQTEQGTLDFPFFLSNPRRTILGQSRKACRRYRLPIVGLAIDASVKNSLTVSLFPMISYFRNVAEKEKHFSSLVLPNFLLSEGRALKSDRKFLDEQHSSPVSEKRLI